MLQSYDHFISDKNVFPWDVMTKGQLIINFAYNQTVSFSKIFDLNIMPQGDKDTNSDILNVKIVIKVTHQWSSMKLFYMIPSRAQSVCQAWYFSHKVH